MAFDDGRQQCVDRDGCSSGALVGHQGLVPSSLAEQVIGDDAVCQGQRGCGVGGARCILAIGHDVDSPAVVAKQWPSGAIDH